MGQQLGGVEGVWRERLDRYQTCGLTIQAFCQQEGISESNFYSWKRRLGVSTTPTTIRRTRAEPLFVPVNVSPAMSAREVRIALPGGAVVYVPYEAGERVLKAAIEAAVRTGQEGSAC